MIEPGLADGPGQAQAGAAPGIAGEAAAGSPHRRRAAGVALAVGIAALGVAMLAGGWPGATPSAARPQADLPAATSPVSPRPAIPAVPATATTRVAAAVPSPALTSPAVPAAAAPDLGATATSPSNGAPTAAALDIVHDGARWHVRAAGVTQFAIVARLATLTRSTVFGDAAALDNTALVRLDWQGRGAAAAWRAVLGSDLNYALQCTADRCSAYLAPAATPPRTAVAVPRRLPAGPPAVPLPRSEPAVPPLPGDFVPEDAAIASEDADPRVSSHHDD